MMHTTRYTGHTKPRKQNTFDIYHYKVTAITTKWKDSMERVKKTRYENLDRLPNLS
jgi:hypothetical protein